MCCNRFSDAVATFQAMKVQGIIPNKYVYTTMMNVCSRAGDYANAAEVFAEMQRNGCLPDEVVYCTVINLYGKAGLYDEAEKVFKEMADSKLLSNEKTYTVMANVRAKAGHYKEAVKLFEKMGEKGLTMSPVSWKTLLHCYVMEGDVVLASKVFHDIIEAGAGDAVAYGNMMNMYANLGLVPEAQGLHSQMREAGVVPDEKFYGSLVKLYCNASLVKEAKMVVEEMEQEGFVPDQIINTTLMQARAFSRVFKPAMFFWDLMLAIFPTCFSAQCHGFHFLQAYGRVGRLQEAEMLFKSMKNADGVAISTMLTLYEGAGKNMEALTLKQNLLDQAMQIDSRTLNQLITKHVKAGLFCTL
jgi:pentatricopeptide repeat protein